MATKLIRVGPFVLASVVMSATASAQEAASTDLPLAIEEALLAPNAASVGDEVGACIALSGDTLAVGAPSYNSQSGTVLVYVRTGATWTQQAQLIAFDPGPDRQFGFSLALRGDTLVVGARRAPVGVMPNGGAAYVFVRTGSTWTENAKLVASDPHPFDGFGQSVALDGNTLLVGADFADSTTTQNIGATYVFIGSATAWTQQAKLVASDAGFGHQFGFDVQIDGDTALIGSPRRPQPPLADVGAAYVFVRSGATWSEQALLAITDPVTNARAGTSVDLEGDTAVVGAHFYIPNGQGGTAWGRAYVYARTGSSWAEESVVEPSDPHSLEQVGASVDLDGDQLALGAPTSGHDSVLYAGSAYVFRRAGAEWTMQSKLFADALAQLSEFGAAVALEGDTVAIGAPSDAPTAAGETGSARVFRMLPLDSFCFGDGSLATACPCAPPNIVPSPSGGPDSGCANSFDLDGARLDAYGSLNTALRLHARIAAGYANFAYAIKGDAEDAAGFASGDGVRCASGGLLRFGGHNAGTNGAPLGEWTYPNFMQPTSIVALTGQPAGSLAVYQVLYRNAAASFCSDGTYNVTNAVRVAWP